MGLVLSCATAQFDRASYDTNNTMTIAEREQAVASIFFTTDPPGAAIFMGKKYVGRANREEVPVFPGQQVITLIKDEYWYQDTMIFREGNNGAREITLHK